MHYFLTEDLDFDQFPSEVTGRYIKGMPMLTFEALLQSISTRIYLYQLSIKGTYNTRSVSTLCNESFSSDMKCLEKDGVNYPKTCNVGKIIGNVVTTNNYKHNVKN